MSDRSCLFLFPRKEKRSVKGLQDLLERIWVRLDRIFGLEEPEQAAPPERAHCPYCKTETPLIQHRYCGSCGRQRGLRVVK